MAVAGSDKFFYKGCPVRCKRFLFAANHCLLSCKSLLCKTYSAILRLAVSFLPYSPAFLNWHSAWDYLRPHGLKRGARMFLREQTGAVSVGPDQQLYASNKYFA